jgi:hypothetical protein
MPELSIYLSTCSASYLLGYDSNKNLGLVSFFFHPNLPPSNEGNIFFKIVLHTFCIKQESRIAFVQSDLGEAKRRHVTKMLFSTISTYRLYALGSTAPSPPNPDGCNEGNMDRMVSILPFELLNHFICPCCSEDWPGLSHFRFGWELDVWSLQTVNNCICWCFRCVVWIDWVHAFRAHDKLDTLCK